MGPAFCSSERSAVGAEAWCFLVLAALSLLGFAICLPIDYVRAFGCAFFGAMALACGGQALALCWRGRPGALGRVCRRVSQVGRVLFWTWLALFLATEGWILSGSRSDAAAADASVIVVLGAGLKPDGTPSWALQSRLQTAREHLLQNPESIAVLCGGQGADEVISEAQSMETWLLEHGVASERLLREERSSSTRENVKNARALLEKQGLEQAAVAVVTNEFHLRRAKLLTRREGMRAAGLAAKTPLPPYRCLMFVRESFSVWKMILQGV